MTRMRDKKCCDPHIYDGDTYGIPRIFHDYKYCDSHIYDDDTYFS